MLAMAQASFDYTCRNDWAKALTELAAAEAGLPNDAQVQYRIAMADRRLGRWQETLDRLGDADAVVVLSEAPVRPAAKMDVVLPRPVDDPRAAIGAADRRDGRSQELRRGSERS